MIEKYGTVEMKDWGKDHWCMLVVYACIYRVSLCRFQRST